MKTEQEFDRLFRQEFKNLATNMLWRNNAGDYEVFDHYRITKDNDGYRVFCSATDVGNFSTSKTALSWCIADKYQAYNTARDILNLDTKLKGLTSDINARARLADNSNKPEFREIVEVKLETKIIRKKQVENELAKCVNWAKYIQQRGFNNETVRTGRNAAVKTSR